MIVIVMVVLIMSGGPVLHGYVYIYIYIHTHTYTYMYVRIYA